MEPSRHRTMTPEAMVKAILRRRENTGKDFPKELELRTNENDRAYQLVHEAKANIQQLKDAKTPPSSPEYVQSENEYKEHETFRRRTTSRLWVVKNAIKDHEEGMAFWNELQSGDWGHLLEDAARVRDGGRSSYTLERENNESEASS